MKDKKIICISISMWIVFVFVSLINSSHAQSNSNITGTYDGKGIYKVEDMSVKITSNKTFEGPQYRFLGSITNISNETMYLTGVAIQMYDKNNKLIDYTSVNGAQALEPEGKVVYKAFAPTVDNEDFDHYIVSAVGGMNPSGYTTTPSQPLNDFSNTPPQSGGNESQEELYRECVGVAGKSFCDFLFKK